jgi:hypothetical protein
VKGVASESQPSSGVGVAVGDWVVRGWEMFCQRAVVVALRVPRGRDVLSHLLRAVLSHLLLPGAVVRRRGGRVDRFSHRRLVIRGNAAVVLCRRESVVLESTERMWLDTLDVVVLTKALVVEFDHDVWVGKELVNGEEELRKRPEAFMLLVRLADALPMAYVVSLRDVVPFDNVLPLEFGLPFEVVVIVMRVVVLLTTYTTGLLPEPIDV